MKNYEYKVLILGNGQHDEASTEVVYFDKMWKLIEELNKMCAADWELHYVHQNRFIVRRRISTPGATAATQPVEKKSPAATEEQTPVVEAKDKFKYVHSAHIPCGAYFIGDPRFIIGRDTAWAETLDTWYSDSDCFVAGNGNKHNPINPLALGSVQLSDGGFAALVSTGKGDGSWSLVSHVADVQSNTIGIDCGLIGLIPIHFSFRMALELSDLPLVRMPLGGFLEVNYGVLNVYRRVNGPDGHEHELAATIKL